MTQREKDRDSGRVACAACRQGYGTVGAQKVVHVPLVCGDRGCCESGRGAQLHLVLADHRTWIGVLYGCA